MVEMEKVTCQFCSKAVLSNNLGRHQKTGICLAAQGRSIQSEFVCDWCGDGFPRSDTLKKHHDRCKQRTKSMYTSTEDQLREENRKLRAMVKSMDLIISSRDTEISENALSIRLLQKEIAVLKTVPPTVVQNITNNIRVDKFVVQQYAKDNFAPLTDGLLKECLSVDVDPKLLLRGPEAIAQLILETSLEGRNKVACTDTSRSVCLWKERDHTVITDMKMKKLMPRLVRPIYSAYSVAWRRDDELGTDEYQAVGEVVNRLRSISTGKDTRSKYYNTMARQIMDANSDLLYMLDEDEDREQDENSSCTS